MAEQGKELEMEAAVKCLKCGSIRWVAWRLRHSGMEKPPQGVAPDSMARCLSCHAYYDWTVYAGARKWKT